MPLPKDTTLRSLQASHGIGEDFVRRVVLVLHEARKAHGPVAMRLGITGTGQAPNYRLEDEQGQPLLAIDGANHRPWPDGARLDATETWSSATMTEEEVKSLLGEIRGSSSRGPRTRA